MADSLNRNFFVDLRGEEKRGDGLFSRYKKVCALLISCVLLGKAIESCVLLPKM
jgi:hypothetical protein